MLEKLGMQYGSASSTYRLKKCDLIRRKVLYNIFSEFGTLVKPARLIKMSLNKTHSEIRISKVFTGVMLV
jgi:hypothetical protein